MAAGQHGTSRAAYSRWRARYADATVSALSRLRALEQGNAQLERMYAELALEHVATRDVPNRTR